MNLLRNVLAHVVTDAKNALSNRVAIGCVARVVDKCLFWMHVQKTLQLDKCIVNDILGCATLTMMRSLDVLRQALESGRE